MSQKLLYREFKLHLNEYRSTPNYIDDKYVISIGIKIHFDPKKHNDVLIDVILDLL